MNPTVAMKIHNFSAGPAILPASVIRESAQAVANFNNSGLSILELSHRGPELTAVFNEATALTRELLQLPSDYEVLFMTGGASTQFFIAAMNLLDKDETAGYLDTGTWASKAIEAARPFGHVQVLASSKSTTYDHIPTGYYIPKSLKYLHLTSNNTIYGTQIHEYPDAGQVPVLCDMSSDFMSRPVDVKRFGMIYAGAQKNLGPAGVTMVIIRKDLLGKVDRKIPVMLDYRTFIKEKSLYNTPPVFPIYVSMLTMRWIKEMGGLTAMAKHNEMKANILYKEIDANPLFKGNVAVQDRSLMNVCFTMHDRSLEPKFAAFAKENGCNGLEGHRSVGGFRASIYNAMPPSSIQFLVDLMREFRKKQG
jgi:phosphoserine aminotransferase